MNRRLVNLACYSAGYGVVLLLERAQAQLERQQAERLAQEARAKAELLAAVVVQTVKAVNLEEELERLRQEHDLEAFDASDIVEAHGAD